MVSKKLHRLATVYEPIMLGAGVEGKLWGHHAWPHWESLKTVFRPGDSLEVSYPPHRPKKLMIPIDETVIANPDILIAAASTYRDYHLAFRLPSCDYRDVPSRARRIIEALAEDVAAELWETFRESSPLPGKHNIECGVDGLFLTAEIVDRFKTESKILLHELVDFLKRHHKDVVIDGVETRVDARNWAAMGCHSCGPFTRQRLFNGSPGEMRAVG